MRKHILILFVIISFTGCNENINPERDKGINLSEAMGDINDKGFEKAIEKRKFTFPEDHGPHKSFRTEWWYFTGNLTSEENKKFGYQFTIFRTSLSSENNSSASEWSSNQIYMAHVTLTDISNEKFYFKERFSRDGNQLAGAQPVPFKIWVEDWQITETDSNKFYELPRINLISKTDAAEINLILESTKPVVLQGDEGLSRKGSQKGNASYYYSYTNLKTNGTIYSEGKEYKVAGSSWMDREWSTSALSEDQKGWDWFSLQLEDSTEIMYYQMRKKDGTPDDYSKGVIINRNGESEKILKENVELIINDYWRSPSGVNYPSGWNLRIPSKNIDLKIIPVIKNQLLQVSIKYWEGSVNIEGKKNNTYIKGRGYAELTGY